MNSYFEEPSKLRGWGSASNSLALGKGGGRHYKSIVQEIPDDQLLLTVPMISFFEEPSKLRGWGSASNVLEDKLSIILGDSLILLCQLPINSYFEGPSKLRGWGSASLQLIGQWGAFTKDEFQQMPGD